MGIVRLTNCRLAVGDRLETRDLWISSETGKIVDPQLAFYSNGSTAADVRDLGGRIVAPGFLDVQINGAFGFDFSTPSPNYPQELATMNRALARTGVTSYLPTLPSQTKEVYHQTLHFLGQPETRRGGDGAESLGAHCEGPFINPEKNGIHRKEVIMQPSGIESLLDCYGAHNLQLGAAGKPRVRCVTLAPERDLSQSVVRELRARGIVASVGHSAATYEQMQAAVRDGAGMVTHLYNAMSAPHHRDTGIFGILGREDGAARPCFGVIADGIHVHPSMVRLAYSAHPRGFILVTDSMAQLGMPDGEYAEFPWTKGGTIVKEGHRLRLKGIDGSIAGSAVTLLECLNNFMRWSEAPPAAAIATVTATPARMLGLDGVKGSLEIGADADLVVLNDIKDGSGAVQLEVDQVWKFGDLIHGPPSLAGPAKQVSARL